MNQFKRIEKIKKIKKLNHKTIITNLKKIRIGETNLSSLQKAKIQMLIGLDCRF